MRVSLAVVLALGVLLVAAFATSCDGGNSGSSGAGRGDQHLGGDCTSTDDCLEGLVCCAAESIPDFGCTVNQPRECSFVFDCC
jgi:hypothetical protein